MNWIKSIKQYLPYLALLIYAYLLANFYLSYEAAFMRVFMYTLSTFLFFFLLAQLHSIALKTGIVLTLFLILLIYPTRQMYGEIDFNYMASVYYTNPGESYSYIQSLPKKLFLTIGIASILSLSLVFLKYKKLKPNYLKWIALGLLVVISGIRIASSEKEDYFYQKTGVIPIRQFLNIQHYYHLVKVEDRFIKAEISQPPTWEILDDSNLKLTENFIIVVGESVRKDFLHAYGFPYENTPFADSSINIKFNNYYSVSTNTVPSLMRTLALANDNFSYEVNNSIVRLGELIGYHTYWISNNGQIGQFDSPMSVIGKSSQYSYFIRKGDFTMDTKDTLIIPKFKEVLKDDEEPYKLIFLHPIGSHPDPCLQTDYQYDEFILSDNISCYSQTVLNTDKLLAEIHQILVDEGKPFKLIYFSDHGVIVRDDLTVIHGAKYQNTFEVPMFIWGSDIKEKREINAERTGRDFPHLFTEMNQFTTKNFTKNYRFISEESNDDSAHYVLGGDNIPMLFDTLPRNSLKDFLEIEITD